MQVIGWGQLVDINVYFVGNPSGSFVYVLTGLHGVHLVSAVIFLLVMLVATFRMKVHAKRLVSMEMCITYWHFLDILWIYLFIFMLLNR
jgi:cytochrome c oxidase subunit 3